MNIKMNIIDVQAIQGGLKIIARKTDSEYNGMLRLFLEIGAMMLVSGAEINRVEDTLSRMGEAYGAAEMNVFVITSSIVVTMVIDDVSLEKGNIHREFTQTRRIKNSGGTNFMNIERLYFLSNRFCKTPMNENTLAIEINKIKKAHYPQKLFYLGSILAAGSFAMFFGGNLLDGIIAAVVAVFICIMQDKLSFVMPNQVTFNVICALLSGLLIGVCAIFIPSLNPDKVMIGDIMLLIPGIAMTNAIRDILVGDTIAGSFRFMESFLWAGALACGFMLSMFILSGIF